MKVEMLVMRRLRADSRMELSAAGLVIRRGSCCELSAALPNIASLTAGAASTAADQRAATFAVSVPQPVT